MASDKTKLVVNPLTGNLDTVQVVDDLVEGPASAIDNAVVRYDATTGKIIQGSSVLIDDSNAMSGLTQVDVDNLRLNGNTISSTDTNGNILLSPDGTGEIQVTKALILSGDGTQNLEAVTKQQLDAVQSSINNFSWQDSVIDKDLTAPPGAPTTGDRYLIGLDTTAGAATGDWAGQDGKIAEYNGVSWDFTSGETGWHISADDESNNVFVFGGTTWAEKNYESTTSSGFLSKTGFDIQLTNLNNQNLIIGNGSNVATATSTSAAGNVLASSSTGLTIKNDQITNAMVNSAAGIAYSKLSLTDGIVNADINSAAAIAYSKLNLSSSIVNADINAAAAIAYSKLALSNSIVNADINSAAAIAYSKLSLSDSIVNADINSAAAIAYSKLSLADSIVNADINSAAAIAFSKMENLTSNRALVSDGSGDVSVSTVTDTEIGYLSGTSSNVQTQLNNLDNEVQKITDINYIGNGKFEVNTTGWSHYDDGAVAAPVDGTGEAGATDLSIARTTTASEILRGAASLKVSKAAADAQGEGFSFPFEIDPRDAGRDLIINFDYKMLDANYASSDVIIYVYDIDNTTLIGKVRNDQDGELYYHGGDGTTFKAVFSSTDSLNYRLIFHVATTNATAYDFVIDNVSVGPEKSVPVNIVTDWEQYTPTFQGFGTPTGVDFWWRRKGTDMFIYGAFTTGTVTASEAQIGLPNGQTVKTTGPTALIKRVGIMQKIPGTTGILPTLATGGDTFLNVGGGMTGSGVASNVPQGGSTISTSSTAYEFQIGPIPIEGWSATSQVSTTENTFKNAVVKAEDNSNESLTALTTNIPFSTETKDEFGIWNGTELTAPINGEYRVSGIAVSNAASNWNVLAYIDSGSGYVLHKNIGPSGGASSAPFHGLIELKKGWKLALRSDAAKTLSSTSTHHINIKAEKDTSVFSVTGETELIESSSSGVSYPIAADTWGDLTSITLGPGEWVLKGQYVFTNTGATTYPGIQLAITSTSGNSTTGMVTGDNRLLEKGHNVSGEGHSHFLEDDGVVANDTTTYYLKSRVATSVSNLSVAYKISARRVK